MAVGKIKTKIINTPKIGEIKAFSGGSLPEKWLFCNGDTISRVDYSELFSVIGTAYGGGDGSSTFALPDFSERILIGSSESKQLGSTGGSKTHVLTVSEIPEHAHNEYIRVSNGSAPRPSVNSIYVLNGRWATSPNGSSNYGTMKLNTTSTGSNTAHNIMQPYSVAKYIIYAGL